MISATIQGIHKENNGKHTTAQNGKLITGEAQRKCVNAILKAFRGIKVRKESYFEIDSGELLCTMYHPIKDDIGRMRIALIVLDKDTPNELIQKTLEVMGLDFERFLKLRRKFKLQKVGVSSNTLVIVGGMVLVAFAICFIFKK